MSRWDIFRWRTLAGGRWCPVGTVQRRPRRQPRPLMASSMPRRFPPSFPVQPPQACAALCSHLPVRSAQGAPHWGAAPEAAAETSPSLDFLLAFRVFSPGFIRLQPLPPSPAPETHPVSPFLAFSGCVFLFFVVVRLQNFCPSFWAFCRIVVTI